MSQTGNEKSFLLFRNFPQEEIHETEFHLTSFLCMPVRKKKVESFTIAKHYHYWTESLWGEQVSTVCPEGNVSEGCQRNSCQTVSLKDFLSYYALLNTTEKGREGCDDVMALVFNAAYRSLDCLSSP